MYDELVKSLRICAVDGSCRTCPRFTQCTDEEEGPILAGVFNDAADAIEELSMKRHGDIAAIAGMKREIEQMVVTGTPRWIPVTERLPDKEENVLVWHNGCILLVAFSPKHLQFNNYDILPYDRNNRFDDVKYWMPLPEPPKDALRGVEKIPAEDVAKVVRCKDCRYNDGSRKCLYPDSIIAVPDDDDFCSYGKKREEKNDDRHGKGKAGGDNHPQGV